MGNIRQTAIKNIAIELVTQYPNQFSGDFQANKEKVSELADIGSKLMRNRVAGYVTRYVVSRSKSKPGRPISE